MANKKYVNNNNNIGNYSMANNSVDNQKQNNVITFERLSTINVAKNIVKELNSGVDRSPFFKKFKKEDITLWMSDPRRYSKQLLDVSKTLFNLSNQYKRLVRYFSRMAMLSYTVVPFNLDIEQAKNDVEEFKKNYKQISNIVDGMNIKHEFMKISDVVIREDVFYGYVYNVYDYSSFYIEPLPASHCEITGIEDGCYTFSFDFSYFDTNKKKLEYYPKELVNKYKAYLDDKKNLKYQPIDSGNSICIKFDESLDYVIPPLAGVFTSLFDLEEYKNLKKTSEQLGNYKLLSMEIPTDDDGNFKILWDDILKYYRMIDANLPENIGLAMTPLKLNEHSFERAGLSNSDTIAQANDEFWNQAGVSSQLFNATKSGNSIMSASTETDATFIYGLNRQFERWINYRLKRICKDRNIKYKFKVDMIDCTRFNYTDLIKQLTQGGSYGFPVKTKLSALYGYSQSDLDNLLFLENVALDLTSKFVPFSSSYTTSGNGASTTDVTDEGGHPVEDSVDESGEATRDRDEKDR